MKKRAKILSVLLALTMVVGLMGGCGSSSSTSSSSESESSSEAEESSTETEEAEETASDDTSGEEDLFTVEVWGSSNSQGVLLTELIDEYNETTGKELGIYIDFSYSSDIKNMLSLAQENDELPLIVQSNSGITYEDGGYNIPFTMLPGGQEFLDEWESASGVAYGDWNKFAGSDDIYKIAYNFGGPALYYNEEMLIEAGFVDEDGNAQPPTTWSELVEYAEALTTDGVYGLAIPMQWSSYAEYDILMMGGGTEEDGLFTIDWDEQTYTFNVTGPLEAIKEIYQNGYCVPGAETIDNATARSYFAEGVSAMFLGWTWDIAVFTTTYVADFDWDLDVLYAEDGNNYGMLCSVGSWYSATTAVLDLTEEEQEKVMSVIEWLYGDEVGAMLVEAGVSFPLNNDHLESADSDAVLDQTYKIMDLLNEYGIMDVDLWNAWEYPRNYVDYDSSGAGWLCDNILLYCQGEMTLDEYITAANAAFTQGLQDAIADGAIDPATYQ
ncbi:MAG: ABC transporter substrate-binding protein [Lachnospiraceae bacterium]|nr:ABC transporter substrate-binding protein [Lachnospiraceae bacterium]